MCIWRLVIIMLLSTTVCAQEELKLKTEFFTRSTDEYYVLKSNKKIKQGLYTKKNLAGCRILVGYYKNNLKDSTWRYYHDCTDGYFSTLIAVGNYKDDQKTGLWNYYDDSGRVIQVFDHTNQSLVSYSPNKEDLNHDWKVIKGNDTIMTKLDRPPLFMQGEYGLLSHLHKVVYPVQARLDDVQDDVIIRFIIDEKGNATNFKIAKYVGHDCDKEALQLIESLPDKWIPAIIDGKPVAVIYYLPVHFGMEFIPFEVNMPTQFHHKSGVGFTRQVYK